MKNILTEVCGFELGTSLDSSKLDDFKLLDLNKEMDHAYEIKELVMNRQAQELDKRDINDILKLNEEVFFESKSFYEFLGNNWSIFLCLLNNEIVRIGMLFHGADEKLRETLFKKTLIYFSGKMGKHDKHPLFSKAYLWYGAQGSVLLLAEQALFQFGVRITIESNKKGVNQTLRNV